MLLLEAQLPPGRKLREYVEKSAEKEARSPISSSCYAPRWWLSPAAIGVHKGMWALPDTPVPYCLMQEVIMGNQKKTPANFRNLPCMLKIDPRKQIYQEVEKRIQKTGGVYGFLALQLKS